MHGDTTGRSSGSSRPTATATGGNTIRVTEMTNYLSNSPTFTYTSLPVAPYRPARPPISPAAPGRSPPTRRPRQVQYRNGHPGDGHGLRDRRRRVHLSQGPVLRGQRLERHADPGQAGRDRPRSGRGVQMPSASRQRQPGNLGFTWMEASSTEFVSMWVGQPRCRTWDTSPPTTRPRAAASSRRASGSAITAAWWSTRPTATTFWAANEYIGPDGDTSDIWKTHITSFSLPPAVNNDWYSINVAAGNSLSLQTYTPSDQGGQFSNTAVAEDRALRHLRQPGRHRHQARRRPQRGASSSTPRSPASTTSTSSTIRAPPASTSCRSNTAAVSVGRHHRPGLQRPERQRQPRSRAIPAWTTGKSTSSTPAATSSPRR